MVQVDSLHLREDTALSYTEQTLADGDCDQIRSRFIDE